MEKKVFGAHLAAFLTMMVWGTSFIVSKLAFDYLTPIQVLFWREIVSILSLFVLYPKFFRWQGWKTELLMFLAAFTAMTLYQFLENYAVYYTEPSNVSVIVSTAPFFTLLVARMFDKTERITSTFLVGFVAAMVGICLFSFNGIEVKLGFLGDFLSLLAAFSWGFYQIIVKKLSDENLPQFALTRRIFEYAALMMLPLELMQLTQKEVHTLFFTPALFYIVFLGAFCSAICYVSWNYAIKMLGAVKSSVYIYLNPVTTLLFSAILFGERLGFVAILGVLLTLLGLVISNEDTKKAIGDFLQKKA